MCLLVFWADGVDWGTGGRRWTVARAWREGTMTLRARDLSAMPSDTEQLGQRLLGADDPYRVIGEHLADILADAEFAELYEPTGRDAIPPSLLALVVLFQFAEHAPDRQAAAWAVRRIDWKYALRLPLEYAGFDYTCLCAFRQRLREHQQWYLVFDTIWQRLHALGFGPKRRTQRTDSLAVLGATDALSHLETVSETLRLAVGALERADGAWVEQELPASFREQYATRRSDYRLTDAEQQAALRQVGQDGCWLLDRLGTAGTEALRGLAAVVALGTVWEQRYRRRGSTLTVRLEGVASPERIITPHDPGVRVGEKRGKTWHGDKVHISETAQPGEVNFLTDVTTAPAPSGDAAALPEIREHLAARALLPNEHVVDSGYISGKQLAQSEAMGITLLGPPLADTSRQEFKIADFQLDRAARHAICPGGATSVKWSPRTERDGSAAVNIQFAGATCAVCPLRPRCTTSQSGRSLQLSEHDERLQARRAEARTPAFRERMRARPAIESTLAELVRRYGLRQHRYRGEAQRHLEHVLKGAACNLFRLVRALLQRWDQEVAAA
jgi:transposase